MTTRIAVTGASGHIGNVVCRRLLEKGFLVSAFFHSDSRSLMGLDLRLVKGNILLKEDLIRLMEGCDVVINCAAIISINGDENGLVFKTNTVGPENVLHAAIATGVKKIIHVSSVHAVEDLPHTMVYNEGRTYKTEKSFVYDFSKALGEQFILKGSKENDIETVVVRPSCVVGPFDFKPSKMGKALMDFYNGKMPVIPSGGYDIVDVRDAAESICNAVEKGRSGEIYLLSGKYFSFDEVVKMIGEISGRRMPKVILPFWLLKQSIPFVFLYSKMFRKTPSVTYESITAIKDGHPNMDNSKARKELSHRPRPLKETVSDFLQWMENKKKGN